MLIEADRVREQLEYRFGEDLRSVGYHKGDKNDHVYIREDIENKYDESDLKRVFQTARFEAIDQDHQESLFVHGELQCVLRCFEKAVELHLIKSEREGVVAAVEAGAIDDLQGTIEAAVAAIEETNSENK